MRTASPCPTSRKCTFNSVSEFSTLVFSAFGFSVFEFSVFGFSAFGFSAFGFSAFGFSVFGFSVFGFSVSASFKTASASFPAASSESLSSAPVSCMVAISVVACCAVAASWVSPLPLEGAVKTPAKNNTITPGIVMAGFILLPVFCIPFNTSGLQRSAAASNIKPLKTLCLNAPNVISRKKRESTHSPAFLIVFILSYLAHLTI